ncbi:hypothetical protein SAMN06265365_105277 [Tistlia consotensis]|uniref:Uncharacterized protein n=1 Tax=Tistlia consotensis USBA 355 TaxID=560819 RepID=A0A1Y6BIR6_9PROT|nr:hypothetical protein [Tistlia consotensis]SMF11616.1 hypothetical protein SAMN05428998_10521 [Tistlia consotensis USBA 355]SNR51795.1 hypothetical protein SAMN06265365_105277 [Tistlia consotensis]
MVEIYQTIEQHRHGLSQLHFDEDLEAAWPFTLGGTVMNRSLGQAIHQNTDYVVASQVQAYLNGFLRANRWEWNPRGYGGSGGAVLDFEQESGSCWFPAMSLELLLYAPLPYGFEQDQSEVTTREYKGAANSGFVTRHDHRRAFGLGYNIVNRNTTHLWQGYYFWGSHVVTAFDDQFYDPSYNRRYAEIDDMAFAEMARFDDSWNEAGTIRTRAVTTADLSNGPAAALDGVYVQITGGGYGTRLAERAQSENRQLGADLYDLPFAGPFDKPFDPEANYQLDLG